MMNTLRYLLLLSACGSQPGITNTVISPASFQISGIVDTAQFTLTTDVLHFGTTVTSVTAQVQGQNVKLTLGKSQDILAGERWSVTTQLTLWSFASSGQYDIDVTAVDSNGTSVTKAKAATVTITN